MSRRMALFLAAALTLPFSRAASQNLARLERMWKDAAAASARVDSLARVRMRATLDTVQAGNLVLLAQPALVPVATAAVPIAWGRLEAVYGEEAHTARGPIVVVLYQSDSGPPPYGYPIDATLVPEPLGVPDVNQMVATLDLVLPRPLQSRLDPQLERWINGPVSTTPPDHVALDVFEDLVTSPSPFGRSCFAGSMNACATGLGLLPTRDPVTAWYDPTGRRELVRRLRRDPYQPLWYDQCVGAGVDAACIRVLHGPDSAVALTPLSGRELLVRIALSAGGAHAFHRLLATAGQPLPRRLEATAGVPLDSLLARWRTTVIANRPSAVVLTPGLGWVALTWAFVLGYLVLGSSRWRF